MSKRTTRKVFWISFGLVSIIIRTVLSNYPAIVEEYYSRSVFLGIRWLFDTPLYWLPFPWVYIFVPVVLGVFFYRVIRLLSQRLSFKQKLLRATLGGSAFILGMVGAFIWLWGFNYIRVPLEDQLSLAPKPLGLGELKSELELETEKIIELRAQLTETGTESDSIAIVASQLPADYQNQVRSVVEEWLEENNFPIVGAVRGREIYPKGIFLRFSSSGLYFPYTGEGHVDAGVHPLQKPHIVAHEMSHGYGFSDEGTCNFTAYLACIRSDDPFIAYSGHLNYWRTLAINYLRYKPREYREFRRELPLTIQADLDAINESLLHYPDIMPRLRYYAYDAYLKSQGIHEGMKNYNRVIMLVHAWRQQKRT